MDKTEAPVSPERLFGAVLRSFRTRGLRETAARIPMNFSHLAKWERGERPVPREMVPALDRVYAADGALITLHELITLGRIGSAADEHTLPTWVRAYRRAWPYLATGDTSQALHHLLHDPA